MKNIFLVLIILIWHSFAIADEEIDLNRNEEAKNLFLSYSYVQEELSKLKLETEDYHLKFLYFVSFPNRMPPGLPPGYYIANEHIMVFKSTDNQTICEIRANILWMVKEGKLILDEDYSEPTRPYSCYKKNN